MLFVLVKNERAYFPKDELNTSIFCTYGSSIKINSLHKRFQTKNIKERKYNNSNENVSKVSHDSREIQ